MKTRKNTMIIELPPIPADKYDKHDLLCCTALGKPFSVDTWSKLYKVFEMAGIEYELTPPTARDRREHYATLRLLYHSTDYDTVSAALLLCKSICHDLTVLF